MKKIILKISLLSAAMLLVYVGSAFARPVAGGFAQFSNPSSLLGTTSGGEFLIDVENYGSSPDYIAFCLELNETISRTGRFNIDTVNGQAEAGGVGGVEGNGDPLAESTKWVYWNYITDWRINGWQNGSEIVIGNELADIVQETIWDLEDEGTYTSDFLTMVGDENDYGIAGGDVFVLNLSYSNGTKAQSMLVGAPVPEPATMLLFGTGLLGLAGVARRRNKKKA